MADNKNVSIPTYENFLKGLNQLKNEQLQMVDTRHEVEGELLVIQENFGFRNDAVVRDGDKAEKLEQFIKEASPQEYERYKGLMKKLDEISISQDSHYQIGKDGELTYPQNSNAPFSKVESLLEIGNGFSIDYNAAAEYYKQHKSLAINELNKSYDREEYQPTNPLSEVVKEKTSEVKSILSNEKMNLSSEQINEVLDDHLSKIENILNDFTQKINNAPKKDINQLQKDLREKVTQAFKELINTLERTFNGIKDQTKEKVNEKVHDIKTEAHNAVSVRMQRVNDKIKNISNVIDEKFNVNKQNLGQEVEKESKEVSKDQKEHTESSVESNKTDNHSINSKNDEKNESISEKKQQELAGTKEPDNLDVAQLNKENKGLKTFVNIVKNDHKKVYDNVLDTLKNRSMDNSNLVKQETQKSIKKQETVEL